MNHLLQIDDLSRDTIVELMDEADRYIEQGISQKQPRTSLSGITVGNLFLEPSTRTRVSFELASLRLGAQVINLDRLGSSAVKGETLLDTLYTLQAMSCDVFVIRQNEPGAMRYLADNVDDSVCLINAGEAHSSHPTQGLLDVLTIRQAKKDFAGLKVAIIGDIRHSRVARSAWAALKILGVGQCVLAGPGQFMPDTDEFEGCDRMTRLEDAVRDADVVMTLRIQQERMDQTSTPDQLDFYACYGLTEEKLASAKPDAIVMHPGPMNRGVEIESTLADGPRSVIRQQVRNGVAIRMAVMNMLVGHAE